MNHFILIIFTRISALILSMFYVQFAHAACVNDSPVAAAKSFYAKHPNFYAENPAAIKNSISPRLFSALMLEHKCAQGDICAIEASPWTNAQDGNIEKPMVFDVLKTDESRASVRMRYTFALAKTKKRQQNVVLKFEHSAANKDANVECWVLSDLINQKGESLVSQLENWHKKYGSTP
jgi:hypothetical protein